MLFAKRRSICVIDNKATHYIHIVGFWFSNGRQLLDIITIYLCIFAKNIIIIIIIIIWDAVPSKRAMGNVRTVRERSERQELWTLMTLSARWTRINWSTCINDKEHWGDRLVCMAWHPFRHIWLFRSDLFRWMDGWMDEWIYGQYEDSLNITYTSH